MFLKKPIFSLNVNPQTILTLIVWLIVAWILSRPLVGIGQGVYKLLGTVTSQTFQGLYESKSSAEDLLKSKTLLNEQANRISLLEIKLNYLRNQISELEKLKQILDLKKHLSYKAISATVIGRTADNWHKQIILDKGKTNGLKLGDAVLSEKGVIGQIVDIDKSTSIIQLISDPAYKLGCKISKRKLIGILSGKTNSVGLLEFIPIGTDVKVGDLVVTSGIGSQALLPTYPSGHIVGKVSKVSKRSSRASDLYIEVKLAEDLNFLSDVLVFSPR